MTAIERIRTIRGMTKKVAEACGVSPSTVSEWSQIPSHHIAAAAEALGMTPSEVRPDLGAVFDATESN